MRKISIVAVLVMGFLFSGCADKALESDLATKESQESPNLKRADLRQEVEDLINKAKISDDKKNQLKELHSTAGLQSKKLNDESLKLRSVLIKEVLSQKYNRTQVMYAQDRIKEIENKRLALMFNTVDRVNGILGRETNADDNERLMDEMILYQGY